MDQGAIFLIVVAIVVGGIFWRLRALRRKSLMEKYGDQILVDRLMRREIWEGQTEAQLLDARGNPAAVDRKVLKTKTSEVWKYERIGKGQYGLRVFVENGSVAGWKKNAR
jgi:hypothetical protein